MGWQRNDDGRHENPKLLRAGLEADGLHQRMSTYCARHETDGFVDEIIVEGLARVRHWRRVVGRLVDEGLVVWDEERRGWWVHDYLEYNPSRAELEQQRGWDRTRKALYADKELVAAVKKRDGDRCRYCGRLVDWRDRRSSAGATFDHVIPRGPATLENIVVACRGCNSSKCDRSLEQAGMRLLPPRSLGASGPPDNPVSSSVSSPELDTDEKDSVRVSGPRPDPTRPDPINKKRGPSPSAPEAPNGSRFKTASYQTGEKLLREWCESCTPHRRVAGWPGKVKILAGFLDSGRSEADLRAVLEDVPVVSTDAIQFALNKRAPKREAAPAYTVNGR